ncbi:MAG: helix-turn-helix domain-containing protein [Synergistaceae bacterium]|nr:helix-turn-helix domain-containing protein [Synergistaceae bacterium]
MDFKTRLREARKSRSLTQVEVASHINLKERQYQNLEAGTSKSSFDSLIALADYFNVSLDYLVGRSDDPERRKN